MDITNINQSDSEDHFGPDEDLSFLDDITNLDESKDENGFNPDEDLHNEGDEITDSEIEDNVDSEIDEVQTADKFFKSLHEKGVASLPLELIDEYRAKISDDEELLSALFQEDKKHYAEKYYTEEFSKRFSEETRLLIEAELSGVNINEYNQLNNTYKYLSSIKEDYYDDENFVKQTLAYKYQSKGLTEEVALDRAESFLKIDASLAKSEAKEFNEDAALKVKHQLSTIFPEAEKRKQEEIDRMQNEVIQFETKLQSYVESRNEIITGIPMNGIVKSKIVDAALSPIGVKNNGEKYNLIMDLQEKDPVGFEAKLNFLALLGVFDDKIGVSKIKEFLETQKTLNKKNEYRGSSSSSSSTSYYNQPKKTNKNKSADDPNRF